MRPRSSGASNALASPFSFDIETNDQLTIYNTIEDRGEETSWRSTTPTRRAPPSPLSRTETTPSSWPDPVWLIVSLADPDNPVVRGWDMRDGKVAEVELEIG